MPSWFISGFALYHSGAQLVEQGKEYKQDLPDLYQLSPAQLSDFFSTVSSCTSSDPPVHLEDVTKGTVLQLSFPGFLDHMLWNQLSLWLFAIPQQTCLTDSLIPFLFVCFVLPPAYIATTAVIKRRLGRMWALSRRKWKTRLPGIWRKLKYSMTFFVFSLHQQVLRPHHWSHRRQGLREWRTAHCRRWSTLKPSKEL